MTSRRPHDRRASLLARCRAVARALLRPFRGSSRGAGMVEYVIVTGFVALFAIGAFARFGTIINKGEKAEAKRIEGEGLPSVGDLLGGLGDAPPPVCQLDETKSFCVRGSGFCFAKGTPVAAEGGDRPIESIAVGDRVWARDAETGVVELRSVTTTFVTEGMPTIDLKLSAGQSSELVTVTPGHRFWVEGQGWTPAGDLEASPLKSLQDSLWAIPLSGVPPPLSATPLATRSATTTVYNFEVDGFHSYYVGHLHALVHNQNSQPNPNNCPDGGTGQGTGGTPGTGVDGGAPKANPLVPCYKGPSTAIPQTSFPPNITKDIQDIADKRKTLSGNDKGLQSEKAGDKAAEGFTDNNFPAPTWQCSSASGSRVFDRTCVNAGTGQAVIVEAKGGNSSLGTRLGADGVTPVKQGTPEYVDAVLSDLRISNPTLYAQLKAARDSGDLRYFRVNQKFDAKGDPKPAQVREFEMDDNQRATNCQK